MGTKDAGRKQPAPATPQGVITRGTTNPNRLRRVDRFLHYSLAPTLRRDSNRLIVDLGYGATGTTPAEMHDRLRAHFPQLRTLGLEIDPARVAAAQAWQRPGLSFARGGFEVPTPDAERPVAIRALNVLRQYSEAAVNEAWALMTSRLAPDGILVEGTCDEIGRKCVFLTFNAHPAGIPQTLTISTDTARLPRPSDLADRLPKALIHHNVPGQPIHEFLQALDRAWDNNAALSTFGAKQRWIRMCAELKATGMPVLHGPKRWRLGEITVPWELVAPKV